MKLYGSVPETWQELQVHVARLLTDCGYKSTVEKSIQLARGTVEIDCFAEKLGTSKTTMLVECKHWKRKISQGVIHSFRTVMADSGANFGFIVSKNGFQTGSDLAAQFSNIKLLTLEEFEDLFMNEWFENVIERNFEVGQELLPYSQFNFVPKEYASLDHESQRKLSEMLTQFNDDGIDFLTLKEHYYALPKHIISRTEIDLRILAYGKRLPAQVQCYADYFHFVFNYCIDALKRIDGVYDKKIRRNLFDFNSNN